jgi:tripartite-type tricarboxylate transporter receptor subunit TctC
MIRLVTAWMLALGMCAFANAQQFPAKPVHMIIGAAPGSTVDVMARLVCEKLSEQWGQRVLVESKPGAGGTIATAAVAKSQPDGYTLLWHSNAFAVAPALYEKLPYDPTRDFSHVAGIVAQPFVLVVAPASGLKSVENVVAVAKAQRGQLTFASVGSGSATHFAAEKFRLAAGIDATHIPYKGGAEANADVIAGRVSYWFSPIAIALPHIRAGRLNALGVSSAARATQLAQVPTVAEAGLAGFEYAFWIGVWAPAGMPQRLVEQLARDLGRAVTTPEVRERLAGLGAEPMHMAPGDFARFVRSEIDDSARIVKAARISVQ